MIDYALIVFGSFCFFFACGQYTVQLALLLSYCAGRSAKVNVNFNGPIFVATLGVAALAARGML